MLRGRTTCGHSTGPGIWSSIRHRCTSLLGAACSETSLKASIPYDTLAGFRPCSAISVSSAQGSNVGIGTYASCFAARRPLNFTTLSTESMSRHRYEARGRCSLSIPESCLSTHTHSMHFVGITTSNIKSFRNTALDVFRTHLKHHWVVFMRRESAAIAPYICAARASTRLRNAFRSVSISSPFAEHRNTACRSRRRLDLNAKRACLLSRSPD